MNHVSLDLILELMRDGTYSGCLAITTAHDPGLTIVRRLSEAARKRYRSVGVLDLSNGSYQHSEAWKAEIVFVCGLENLSPQNKETYALRSALDARRYSGLFSIICLSTNAFLSHFRGHQLPFYDFCGCIKRECIREFINESEVK